MIEQTRGRLAAAIPLGFLLFLAACVSRGPAARVHPLATTTASAAVDPAAVAAMRSSVTYLASDELEGRGIDTAGINLAAAYIAGDFTGSGLLPLPGIDDYFQRFQLSTVQGIGPETLLSVDGTALRLNEDYIVMSVSGENTFSAPAVFVGFGITSEKHHYDDYAGVDVKGKVAVAWRYEPADKNGKSLVNPAGDWSELAHLDTKAKTAADHGAVALVLANPPRDKEREFLLPFAHSYQEGHSALPFLHVKRKFVDAWIKAATGKDARAVEEQIEAGMKPASLPLKDVILSGKVALKRTTRELKNVVGYLPGAGPHADEYVVVGAHYDHLGRGGPGSLAPNSHEIHHGADDNASGTATVLELAREFGRAYARGERWERSIVFIAFTGEEEGLYGSAHFVNHPPIAINKIAAMLNLDMVGRLRKQELLVGGSGTAPSLKHLLNESDAGLALKIKDSGEGGLGPSDHMSFAIKKVPVLFFFTGLHADYHRPTDTTNKINFDGMEEVVALSKRLVVAMTRMPKEQYVSAADAHSMAMGMGAGPGGERRATLGVIPSYGEEDPNLKGVKITGTTEGSPAAKAGLVENDVIVGFNGKVLDNLMDLSTALAESKPGDKVKLKVLRSGKEVAIEATLAERK